MATKWGKMAKNGDKMATKNGVKMGSKWRQNAIKIGSKWRQNGDKMAKKWR